MISYKFYSTKKAIPWMLGGENIHPQPSIGDGFFDFQLIKGKQFNFIDVFTATIVCDSDEYTYWKVERYNDNQLEKTFYFYTNQVIRYLKNSYELQLTLDTYLTYTRKVLNSTTNINPWINRGSITGEMLDDNTYREAILKALKEPEQNILGGNDSYSNAEIFNFLGQAEDGKASGSYYPFGVKNITYNVNESAPDVIKEIYPDSFNNRYFYRNEKTSLWRHVVKKDGKQIGYFSIHYTKWGAREWRSGTHANWKDAVELEKQIKSSYTIEAINKEDNLDNWDEINRNMMNGYFMVFFHKDGWIDAYPILGEVNARINTFFTKVTNTGNVTQLVGTGDIEWNLDKKASTTMKLYNDYVSIKKDYIDNLAGGYTVQSYQGIYRWFFPLGDKSHIQFSWSGNGKKIDYPTGDITNGPLSSGTYASIRRFFYRFKYNEAMKFNLIDGKSVKPFKLCNTTGNIINDYVNLLQPIIISGNEFIPAKYVFLSKKVGNEWNFSIPLTTAFTGSFKLYCITSLYNNPTLINEMGGTLPDVNGQYLQTLRDIEAQKNAGVASAIGNLFARPINWLSGGFSKGYTGQISDIESDTTAYNKTTKYGPKGGLARKQPHPTKSETQNTGWNYTGTEVGQNTSGVQVGGLGGFIGDFINIANTIRQAEVKKKNIGIGYLATTDNDIYNAITHNAFVTEVTTDDTYYPLKKGVFSIMYRKLFDKPTQDKYKYYYNYFGFPIDDYMSTSYVSRVIDYVNKGEIGFISFDRNWCLTNLNILSDKYYNDNVVRNAIIDQLTEGVRMRYYS